MFDSLSLHAYSFVANDLHLRLIMKKTLLIALLALPLIGCVQNQANQKVICTSFYPLYYLASQVVGDTYTVKNLTPVGAEPHDYELTTKDLIAMDSCAAIFINGLGMESWQNALPDSISKKTHLTTSTIDTLKIDGVDDPHVWLNPINAIKQLDIIYTTLCDLDKDNKATFDANYASAKRELIDLDNYLSEERKGFDNEYFAISHAAFGYLADRYHLKQIYVSGISPSQEPSAQDMEKIASQIKEHHISTIFTEELVSKEISEAIARETGAKLDTLNPLEGLEEEEEESEDYISIMKENFSKLKEASK